MFWDLHPYKIHYVSIISSLLMDPQLWDSSWTYGTESGRQKEFLGDPKMSQTRFQDKSNPDQNFDTQRERNFWGFFEGYPVIQYLMWKNCGVVPNMVYFASSLFCCVFGASTSFKDQYLRRNLLSRGKLMFPMEMPRVREGNICKS